MADEYTSNLAASCVRARLRAALTAGRPSLVTWRLRLAGFVAGFAAVVLLAAPSTTPALATRAIAPAPGPGSQWLQEINRYRLAAGVPPVSEEPAWEAGLGNHLAYMEDTPAQYLTGAYVSLHTENPASPYYTPSGALEAGYSDLTEGGGHTGLEAIDSWWAAPFHAIGMLRPKLTRVELANNPASGFAGLDVIQGLEYGQPAPTSAVLFPGPGVTTDLTELSSGEQPTPLDTCGWRGLASVGLPLIALLAESPVSGLSAVLTGPGGGTESSGDGELCVVDEHTYTSTNPTYGPTGREILESDKAVLLIPRHPLASGTYTASIHQPGRADVAWSFAVNFSSPEGPLPPVASSPPRLTGGAVQGVALYATGGTWSNNPTSAAYQWQRCNDAGGDCQEIAGATADAYTLTAADVGSTLRVREIASNGAGASAPVSSPPSAVVVADASTSSPATSEAAAPGGEEGLAGPGPEARSARVGSRRTALPVRLILGRGRAVLHGPRWILGRRFFLAVDTQRRVCPRASIACRWRTIQTVSRWLRVTGASTRFSVPEPTGRLRVRALIVVPPFLLGGASFPTTKLAGIEP